MTHSTALDAVQTLELDAERVRPTDVAFIPLLAVETIEPDVLDALPDFKARLEWFLEHRPNLAKLVSCWHEPGMKERRLLALVRGHRMKRLLKRMLDPEEFLIDYGVRAISKYHAEHPYDHRTQGVDYVVTYEPGESSTGLFGGNSNWRGPIWFPSTSYSWVRFIFLHSSTIVSVTELTHPYLPGYDKLILCKKMKRTPYS